MNVDMQQFCAAHGLNRPYLERPFTVGEYSYATNGHIMVRVPRRDDIPVDPDLPAVLKPDGPLAGNAAATYRKPNLVEFPRRVKVECAPCGNRGRLHSCPDCECECPTCEGKGGDDSDANVSVFIGDIPVALTYARQVASLPSVEIGSSATRSSPIPFRFDGGEGALMPLVHGYPTKLDIIL